MRSKPESAAFYMANYPASLNPPFLSLIQQLFTEHLIQASFCAFPQAYFWFFISKLPIKEKY